MDTFDIFILYLSGERQIIQDVTNYGVKDHICFYEKNGVRTTINLHDVIGFGRKEFLE